MSIFKKNKLKDLPKQFNVWAKDQQNEGAEISRCGDEGFVTFADAVNWAFDKVPATYFNVIFKLSF